MLTGPDGITREPPPPPPPPHHVTPTKPAAAPATTAGQTASFNSAVQTARASRASAEGLPPWSHGYETGTLVAPGDTMYGIATQHHDSLPDEEADNAQIPDPNLLHPNQLVFSPGQSPVSPATTAQIQAAQQADAALADAPAGQSATRAALQHASQRQWADVQTDIAGDLRAQAGNKLQPDKVVQPTVQALDQWAIGSDKLSQATQAAYKQVDGEWQQQGITSQQLAPVLQARLAATQDEAALSKLHAPTNRAIVDGEQAQAGQAWTKVQSATQQWLENNAGTHAFPEVAAAQKVKQLDALFPHDTKFAAANQMALQGATQTWNSLGITHAKLDPVLNAYQGWQTAVQQRSQAENNPHLHNEDPNAPSPLNRQVNAAQGKLQAAIETQLNDAAAQSSAPQGRSQAMLAREAILQMVGPQTAGFRNAVDAADTDLQVTKPAQQVAAAYQSGGASAASQALLKATQDAGPGYAGRIIAASKPTIDSVAGDLNTLAREASAPPIPHGAMGRHMITSQFQSIYGNLSAAVEQTDHGAAANNLSDATRQAADLVGGAIASRMQPNGTYSDPSDVYANAAEDAVGDRQGTSLSLALAGALHGEGKSDTANQVVEGAALGFDQLKTRTDGDVNNFAQVTANLEQLRASWGPFMTSSQLATATTDYAQHNPQFAQQFAGTLSQVQQDGTAIVQARQAFSAYDPSLSGLQNRGDLADAAAHLTGSDRSSLFAAQESGLATLDVARDLQPTLPVTGQAAYSTALDAPGVERSIRTFVNQYLKSDRATPNFSPSLKVSLGLSAVGLGLTTPTALSELQHFNQLDAGGKAVAFYNTLGFGKYATEVVSQTAKTSLTRFLGAAGQGKVVNFLAGVKDSKAFSAFSSFYYLEGAFANGVSAEEAASSGDPWAAGFDSASSLGNVLLGLNAGKGFITSALGVDAAADTTLNASLDWAGPVGAGLSVIAQSGLLVEAAVKQKDAQDALQQQGQQFLEDGLHLRPSIANALADVSDNQHLGPARVLQAYAQQYHIQPQSLLDYLNKQNPADVGNFVYVSELMSPQSNGKYAATSSSDTRNLDYVPGVPFANTVPDYGDSTGDLPNPPGSLRQMQYWAETIFGPQGPPTS